MSHGGPPTAWQKRMHALQAAATAAAADTPTVPRTLLPSVYDDPSSSSTSPRASAADDQPLIQYNGGDTHMEDAPNTHENYSAHYTIFSPEAKPFVPPSAKAPTSTASAMAPISTPRAVAPISTPSAMAPHRRLPPHLTLRGSANVKSVPAIPAPASPAPASSAPIVKTEPPPSPSPSVRSTIPPHRRLRPGPHKSVSTTAEMQRPTQPVAPIAVKASPVSDQHVLVNLQQSSESDQEPWVKIQEPPKVETNWDDLHGLDVRTEPQAVGTEPSSSHVASESEPQISETVSPSPNNTASALDNGALVQTTAVSNQDQMTNGARRFGRNEWLPMLLSMNDTDKGRQLIRAFTDHIRNGLNPSEPGDSDPGTEQALLMEFDSGSGQLFPAAVARNTTISELAKEFAIMVKANESDVDIILKVRVVEDHID